MQRGIHITGGFLDLEPQVTLTVGGNSYRVDFADRRRKIVVECEGATHRTSGGLTADVHRYTSLALEGWLVLRFTWAQVVFQRDYVLAALRRAYGDSV